MQHRGQRSTPGQQRRYAKHLVVETCRLDRRRSEQVCMLTGSQILDAVQEKFEDVAVGVADFEKGEVLTDSRGEGSFQQIPRNFRDWSLAIGI